MSKEAMKLALKALENSVDLVREDAYQAEKLYGNYPTRQGKVNGLKVLADDHEKAITALREALAEQPAQQALDKMAENARELGLDYEPAQQEPVAWMFQHGETGRTLCVDALQVKWGFEGRNPSYQKIAPLYISPPAQRTWVGLTDEEFQMIYDNGRTPSGMMEMVESKLREKNT